MDRVPNSRWRRWLLGGLIAGVVGAHGAGLEDIVRQRLQSAEAALVAGDNLLAESEFREALAVSCLQLGAAHLGLQDYAEAENAYRKAARAVGTAEEAALADALADFQADRLQAARKKLEGLIAKAPGNRPVRLLLAKVDFLLADRVASRSQLEQAYGENPEDLNAVYLQALLDIQGSRADAGGLFEEIVRALGDSAQLRTIFARSFREAGAFDSAREQVGIALRLDPEFQAARDELTRLSPSRVGEPGSQSPPSMPSTLRSSRIWPEEAVRPLLDLVSLYEPLSGAAEDGIGKARSGTAPADLPPKSPSRLLGEVRSALRRGDLPSAFAAAELARKKAPNAETVLLHFARASQAAGKPEEAVATYRRLLVMNPDQPGYWLELGSALTRNLELPEALRVFDNYTRLKPDDDQGFVLGGYVHYLLGELDEATLDLKKALDLNPDRIEALHYLALVSYNRGDFPEALRLCETVLLRDPSRGESVLLEGKILRQTGNLPQALERLQSAAQLLPGSPEVHYELSRTLQILGQADEAKKEMKMYQTLRMRQARERPN